MGRMRGGRGPLYKFTSRREAPALGPFKVISTFRLALDGDESNVGRVKKMREGGLHVVGCRGTCWEECPKVPRPWHCPPETY